MASRYMVAGLAVLALAGCAPTAVQKPAVRPAAGAVIAPTSSGLEAVLGRNAAALTAQFGTATLDVREQDARKLQFAGPVCVLDAYLYPPAPGREALVTHLDARRLDGSDFDRASCVAALTAQKQVR